MERAKDLREQNNKGGRFRRGEEKKSKAVVGSFIDCPQPQGVFVDLHRL